jgi:hypothetical protein
MPYDDLTFTREKLYAEVWSRPVMQLAKEVGVSDVAVAKICRRLWVPVPPRGYWARIAAGHTPRKPPLPPRGEGTPGSHVFRRWRAPEGAVASTVTDDDAPSVTVPLTLEKPHALVRKSQSYLARAAKAFDIPARPPEEALDVAASEASLDRALRVMDALLKALEERGHRVEVKKVQPAAEWRYGNQMPPGAPRWHTFAVVKSTPVEFSLDEGYETIEVPPLPPSGSRETRSWDLARPTKERVPNGRLVLIIRNAPRAERVTCADTKRQPIEARLGAFILLLEATASAIEAERIQAAREAEERRRREAEWQKADERRRREEALAKDLDRRLDHWLAALRYRQLADAVEAMASDGKDAKRAPWLAWVRSYAARVERAVVHELPDPTKAPSSYSGY